MKTLEEMQKEFEAAEKEVEKACEGVDPKIVDLIGKVIHAAFLQYTMGMMQQRESNEHCGGILNGKYLVGENCNEHRSKETGSDQADLSLNEQIEILKKANDELSFKLSQLEVSDWWIVWNGGGKALTRENVQVKFRNDQTEFGKIIDWNWDHSGGEWDIIAYRIVKQYTKTWAKAEYWLSRRGL